MNYGSSGGRLREELAARNREYIRTTGLPHITTRGRDAIALYMPSEDGELHGNFIPESYKAITNREPWRRRLKKAHTQKNKLPRLDDASDRPWCELDSCTSSDALLMNIFCFPELFGRPEVTALIGLEMDEGGGNLLPDFGFKARVPRISGKGDATEIDMRLGDLFVEAKLTEANFQQRDVAAVKSYRDLDEVFDVELLPRAKPKMRLVHDHDYGEVLRPLPGERYESYQMIRNVLAAYAHGCRLCVLIHEARIDLREQYHSVLRAVRCADLRTRCTVLTWQELAAALPTRLRRFLSAKYGIE
jgi:hypothetical protein